MGALPAPAFSPLWPGERTGCGLRPGREQPAPWWGSWIRVDLRVTEGGISEELGLAGASQPSAE